MWRRSVPRPNAPVVKRQLSRPRRPLNRGNATRGPARRPEREDDQLDRAVERLASPHEYASLLFCAHHGAREFFAWFHARAGCRPRTTPAG